MKTLEVRRHSLRKQGAGSQLSQEGVDHARKLGETMGPFARVVTSVSPRARETAIAMGFAVDEELVTLASDENVYAELQANQWWNTAQPFVTLVSLIEARGAVWRYAHSLAGLWRDILTGLPDMSAALLITHSGDLEMALVACFPKADHSTWGMLFGPCEGVQIAFAGEPARFTDLEFLRGQGKVFRTGTLPDQPDK